MQSTKRPHQASSVNKAVKHTGGGSHAYYQSLNPNNNIQITGTNNAKSSAQLNMNIAGIDGKSGQNVNAKPASVVAGSNKGTMTTTYVYKRVSQQPEIDLNLGNFNFS